jgi:hypothetical protein
VVGAAVALVLGLGAAVVGLWPGVVSAGLAGGGQAAVFFLGLAVLTWGATRLAAHGDGNDSNTGSNPDARTGRPPPTLGE